MDYTGKGKTNEWYTPRYIFNALNYGFDLDPCSPPRSALIPAHEWCCDVYHENGLEKQWKGAVFMNPPWSGKKNAIVPWLKKFTEHGNGIAIVPARTSCGWFHDWIPRMDAILLPKGKTKFIPGPGVKDTNPMAGVVIASVGEPCTKALKDSGLGIFCEIGEFK